MDAVVFEWLIRRTYLLRAGSSLYNMKRGKWHGTDNKIVLEIIQLSTKRNDKKIKGIRGLVSWTNKMSPRPRDNAVVPAIKKFSYLFFIQRIEDSKPVPSLHTCGKRGFVAVARYENDALSAINLSQRLHSQWDCYLNTRNENNDCNWALTHQESSPCLVKWSERLVHGAN